MTKALRYAQGPWASLDKRQREEIGHPDTKVPLVSCTYNLLNMHPSIAVSSSAAASHSFHVP